MWSRLRLYEISVSSGGGGDGGWHEASMRHLSEKAVRDQQTTKLIFLQHIGTFPAVLFATKLGVFSKTSGNSSRVCCTKIEFIITTLHDQPCLSFPDVCCTKTGYFYSCIGTFSCMFDAPKTGHFNEMFDVKKTKYF